MDATQNPIPEPLEHAGMPAVPIGAIPRMPAMNPATDSRKMEAQKMFNSIDATLVHVEAQAQETGSEELHKAKDFLQQAKDYLKKHLQKVS